MQGAALAALVPGFADRVLVLGSREAEDAALLRARAHRSGRVLHLGDALIAGTAKAYDLCVATPDISDFDVTKPLGNAAKPGPPESQPPLLCLGGLVGGFGVGHADSQGGVC